MELNLASLGLTTGSYNITVFSWTENFEPIMVSKIIGLIYPETISSESSGTVGILFSVSVIISLMALIHLKTKKK